MPVTRLSQTIPFLIGAQNVPVARHCVHLRPLRPVVARCLSTETKTLRLTAEFMLK